MRRLVLIAVALALTGPAQDTASRRAMALTFDDLPFMAGGGSYFPAASSATSEILRVLRRHKAPALGFVNEAQLDAGSDRGARVALLQQWIDAGMTHRAAHDREQRLHL